MAEKASSPWAGGRNLVEMGRMAPESGPKDFWNKTDVRASYVYCCQSQSNCGSRFKEI
jgi:hypothetical protein